MSIFWPPKEPVGGWPLPEGVSGADLFSAMREDEEMRNTKPTGIKQIRHDLGLEPQDEIPGRVVPPNLE